MLNVVEVASAIRMMLLDAYATVELCEESALSEYQFGEGGKQTEFMLEISVKFQRNFNDFRSEFQIRNENASCNYIKSKTHVNILF